MLNKNKNIANSFESGIDQLATAAGHLGVTAMLAATAFSMAESIKHEGHRMSAVLAPEPVYANATTHTAHEGEHMRRGGSSKEEIHHHSATYGAARRSPSVSGSV